MRLLLITLLALLVATVVGNQIRLAANADVATMFEEERDHTK